ncbi:hypothetical protein [Aequorivita marina]|uniref:hypothetical protein n=1 Tax=Aequorivita marina TaxID=3073654 RepID=UPI002875488B|nr:hypothetical protein [Aequorivita sp. S2608]MDS1298600.1 hypothetical protein [Aequorivita sp. S2608]
MELKYIIEICVAVDIAILGIAYPIIVDKISNIGDKYSSNYLSELFSVEFPQRALFKKYNSLSFFKILLYLTISLFLLLIFPLRPIFSTDIFWLDWVIGNSAELLVLVTTLALTISFFIWLDKVVLYNGKSTTLLKRIIRKYRKLDEVSPLKSYHLKTINELTYYALNKPDKHIQETLTEFYYNEFSKIRRNHDKTKPLEYPYELYEFVHNLCFEVINQKIVRLPVIEHRAVSGWWLLGEDFEEITISETTYYWIWRNLTLICRTDKYVKAYWSTAHQYFDYKLKAIREDYDFEKGEIININEVEKRYEERRIFLEFHYALGGLLMYIKNYTTINYLFNYTQSSPPSYALLPETMTEIFIFFEEFRNEFKNRKTPIDLKYYFPELDNLGNRRQVNYWICCYITLLFIRQFAQNEIYTFQDFTGQPTLPEDILELNNWYDGVSYFEKCLTDTIDNSLLMNAVGFENIVKEKRTNFLCFLQTLKENIKDRIGTEKLNAHLSEEKIEAFNQKTKDIINEAFKQYNKIFIPLDNTIEKDDLKLTLQGSKLLFSKSAFTDKDIPNLNFDRVLANQIANGTIKKYIPNSFLISRTRRFLLEEATLLDGIKRLKINKNEFVIVGVNLSQHLENVISNYKDILIKIPSTEYQVKDTLYVINKRDLPSIEFRELSSESIEDNDLKIIDNNIKLYTSIVEIDDDEQKEKWKEINNPRDINVNVSVTIAFLALILWNKKRDIVQLNIISPYREQGIPNSLNEILPFE